MTASVSLPSRMDPIISRWCGKKQEYPQYFFKRSQVLSITFLVNNNRNSRGSVQRTPTRILWMQGEPAYPASCHLQKGGRKINRDG
jgi:hypothetical protein